MKKILFLAVAACMLAGCANQPYPATSDAGERQAAYQATAGAAQATANAAQTEAQRQSARATAASAEVTAQAYGQQMAATSAAAEVTAQAQATAVTFGIEATRQAMSIEATQTAFEQSIRATTEQRTFEATATAAEWDRLATATAEARASLATATAQAVAYQATATRQAWEGAHTATAESVGATAAAYQATSTRSAAIREERLAGVRDYGIPVVLLVLAVGAAVLVVWGIRQWSQRPVIIERSILGDAQPTAVKIKGGGYNFVDLDRQPGPVLKVLPSGVVEAPQLRSAGQEERTTARDQALDAVTRPKLGAGHKATPALPMAAPPEAPAPGLKSVRILRTLGQAERAGLLPPPLVASLSAEWEEEN